jgi:superfamily II DNA or RNA helicase
MCAAPARLGLTATPNQNETGSRLTELVGPIVYQLGISDLAGGFLSSYDIVPVEVELDLDERAAYEASLALFRPVYRNPSAKGVMRAGGGRGRRLGGGNRCHVPRYSRATELEFGLPGIGGRQMRRQSFVA